MILRRLAALAVVAALIPACKFSGFFVPYPDILVNATLNGSQRVPLFATAGTGSATLTVSGLQDKIDYSVTETGLTGVTAVRVHVGAAGTNGPAIFTLATGPFTSPLTGTLTYLNFTPVPGTTNFGTAVTRILNGEAYILITTTGQPTGEIRGQLGAALLNAAKLTGGQVVPPSGATGTGNASVQLNDDQSRLNVTLTFTGVPAPTAAHLHVGDPGVGGVAVFNLSTVAFTSPLTVSLTAGDFLPGGGLVTFAEAVNALLSGRLYVDLHEPGGDLRCQVGPARLDAALTAGATVPPSGSAASGTADLAFNARQTGLTVLLTHNVVTPDGVLIRAELPGVAGPPIFDVESAAGTAASPIAVFIDGAALIAAPGQGISTFADAVDSMIRSRTYIEVYALSLPNIRGQLVP